MYAPRDAKCFPHCLYMISLVFVITQSIVYMYDILARRCAAHIQARVESEREGPRRRNLIAGVSISHIL